MGLQDAVRLYLQKQLQQNVLQTLFQLKDPNYLQCGSESQRQMLEKCSTKQDNLLHAYSFSMNLTRWLQNVATKVTAAVSWTPKPAVQLVLRAPLYFVRN